MEQRAFVISFVFALQLVINRVEQRQRPVLLEEPFRGEPIHWFASESGFRIAGVQRDDLSAAALQGASLLPLIHQEMVQGRKEKRAELSLLACDGAEGVLPEQPGEELLREVLRVMRRVAALADVGVERIPIGLTELCQRLAGAGRVIASGRQHNRPVCGDEDGPMRSAGVGCG